MRRCGLRFGRAQNGRTLYCKRLAGHRGGHSIRLSVPEMRRVLLKRRVSR